MLQALPGADDVAIFDQVDPPGEDRSLWRKMNTQQLAAYAFTNTEKSIAN